MATFIIDEIFLYLVARQKSLWVTQLFFSSQKKVIKQKKKKISIIFGEKKTLSSSPPSQKNMRAELYTLEKSVCL